jgi:large subunit ribosomal protein L15
MKLSDLRPAPGAQKERRRVGRGVGSGHGVTAGKGTKGQKSRTQVKPGFEGGQTPLHRRLPQRRGFNNRERKVYAVVNLAQLEQFDAGTTVSPELLLEKRVIKKLLSGVKVLAEGDLTKALTVSAHKFSKAAEAKIKAAGGSAEVL